MTDAELVAHLRLLDGYSLAPAGPGGVLREAADRIEALAAGQGVWRASEEICEALVRHVEVRGSDTFEKNFVRRGKITCTVWCVVGPNAEGFAARARTWLVAQGFDLDGREF